MPPSSRQIELFEKLTQDRDFSGMDVPALRQQFAAVSQVSASAWIEKALTRPKVDDSSEQVTPPPF